MYAEEKLQEALNGKGIEDGVLKKFNHNHKNPHMVYVESFVVDGSGVQFPLAATLSLSLFHLNHAFSANIGTAHKARFKDNSVLIFAKCAGSNFNRHGEAVFWCLCWGRLCGTVCCVLVALDDGLDVVVVGS